MGAQSKEGRLSCNARSSSPSFYLHSPRTPPRKNIAVAILVGTTMLCTSILARVTTLSHTHTTPIARVTTISHTHTTCRLQTRVTAGVGASGSGATTFATCATLIAADGPTTRAYALARSGVTARGVEDGRSVSIDRDAR